MPAGEVMIEMSCSCGWLDEKGKRIKGLSGTWLYRRLADEETAGEAGIFFGN